MLKYVSKTTCNNFKFFTCNTVKQITHTYTHMFNGLFSRTTWVSRHQKGKPFWILLKKEMMGWQWHQLDHMQSFVPHSRQITTPVSHHSIFCSKTNKRDLKYQRINSALTLLVGGRKGIRPVKDWVVGCWHGYASGSRCRFATATHYLLLQ